MYQCLGYNLLLLVVPRVLFLVLVRHSRPALHGVYYPTQGLAKGPWGSRGEAMEAWRAWRPLFCLGPESTMLSPAEKPRMILIRLVVPLPLEEKEVETMKRWRGNQRPRAIGKG